MGGASHAPSAKPDPWQVAAFPCEKSRPRPDDQIRRSFEAAKVQTRSKQAPASASLPDAVPGIPVRELTIRLIRKRHLSSMHRPGSGTLGRAQTPARRRMPARANSAHSRTSPYCYQSAAGSTDLHGCQLAPGNWSGIEPASAGRSRDLLRSWRWASPSCCSHCCRV